MKKFVLYSKSVKGGRGRSIKSSDNYEELYDKGMLLFNEDTRRDRDYYIIETGVKATKLSSCIIL
jgi:hypothetical protein